MEISTGRRAVQESATSLEDENDDANEHKGSRFTCPVESCVTALLKTIYSMAHVTLSPKESVYLTWPESSTKTSFCMVLVSNQSWLALQFPHLLKQLSRKAGH